LLWLVVAKIALTGVTIGSGGSGGIFGPSMVIGGLLGGAFGTLCHRWIPSVHPASFVLLGMAGFFSAVAKTPISTIIMVSEMTVGYALLLPLMLVSSISYLLMPQSISIYIKQVARRMDSPAHLGDFVVDLLDRMLVGDVMTRLENNPEFIRFDERESLGSILEKVSMSAQTTFPVVDARQIVTSIVRLDDLRSTFMQPELQSLLIAKDVATTEYEPLAPADSLKAALRKMAQSHSAELPVVESISSRRIIGLISRHEILQAYSTGMEKALSRSEGNYPPQNISMARKTG
jgi:CIC family chloride channel protein